MHTFAIPSARRRCSPVILFAVVLAAGCGRPASSSAPRLLTTIAAVRELPPDVAARAWPVRVRGVVTYADAQWGRLFVEDQGRRPGRGHQRRQPGLRTRRSHRGRRMDRRLGCSGPPPDRPADRRTARRDVAACCPTGAAFGARRHDVRRPQRADHGRGQGTVHLERLPAAAADRGAALGGTARAGLPAAGHVGACRRVDQVKGRVRSSAGR